MMRSARPKRQASTRRRVGGGAPTKTASTRVLRLAPLVVSACAVLLCAATPVQSRTKMTPHNVPPTGSSVTQMFVKEITPPDAVLFLDDGRPVKAGKWIPVTPGPHSITGQSQSGYLEDPYGKPYQFKIDLGESKTIPLITVPDNAPATVTIATVDPPGAKITLNGRTTYKGETIGPGTTIEIMPEGSAGSVKVTANAEAEDYKPWSMDSEVKRKETRTLDIKLARLVYGTATLTLKPPDASGCQVVLVDTKGVSHPITAQPKGQRLSPGEYTVKAEALNYREKNPGSTVTVRDHEDASVRVELVKNEGSLKLSFEPKPVVPATVSESNRRLVLSNSGEYLLTPDTPHKLVCKAEGFEDCSLLELSFRPGESKSLTVAMKPLPCIVKFDVVPRDAIVEIAAGDKVVANDASGAVERTIRLDPGHDGSDKVYHYSVAKPGFTKDLLNKACEGDITVKPGKTVSLPDMELRSIKNVLEATLVRDDHNRIAVEKNRPMIGDGLTVEQLQAASRLARDPSVSDGLVAMGYGWKWRDMPQFYQKEAARRGRTR